MAAMAGAYGVAPAAAIPSGHTAPAGSVLKAHGSGKFLWKSVPIGGGGYVLDVYCHPKKRDLVYIRTDVGGFYRWDATGTRWIPLTDQFSSEQSNYYGGEGLALDPSDPNIVYIAAGKYTWDKPGSIFKSTDQGHTWKKLAIDVKMGGNENHRWGGQRLAISPYRSSVLLFGSRKEGLWRSADSGKSWARVSGFPGSAKDDIGISSIAFDAHQKGAVFVSSFGDAVYRSDDDGLTWRKLDGSPVEVERLASSADGSLYATHGKGVAKYSNGAWTDVTPSEAKGGFGGVSVDPKDSRDILVTAQGDKLRLFRSRDAGATWTEKKYETRSSVPWYSGQMKQIQAVAGLTFDPCVPGRIWLTDWYATYMGADVNADPVVMKNFEKGHEELVVFSLAAPPKGLPLLSGVADVDGFPHASLTEFPAHGLGDYYGGSGPAYGDTDQITWCAGSPDHLARVGVKRWDNSGGGTISSDGGKTWSAFPTWDTKIMPSRIAISANDPNNMVVLRVGDGPALYTRDGGKSWQDTSGLPGKIVGDVWYWKTPLAADGVTPGVFYVYAEGKLYKSANGGATFAAIADVPDGGQAIVQTVPGRAGEVWLALGGTGLYHSTDAGKTVSPVPGIKSALLFAPGKAAPGFAIPSLYLMGTVSSGKTGIFQSLNSGVSWIDISDQSVPVGDVPNSMAASYRDYGLVFIGTNGRGIYYGQTEGASNGSIVDLPPIDIKPYNPLLRYSGRFDISDPAGPKCSWTASAVSLKFQGTSLDVKLHESDNSDEYETIIDGKPGPVLNPKAGENTYNVVQTDIKGTHTVTLVKRTEAFFGTTQFTGFNLSPGGKLISLGTAPSHRLEVIGDSISCGYGNEAAGKDEHFSAATENGYLTYGAIAARAVNSDYVCTAWSGRLMWPNNTMGEVYDRILPMETSSHWDFKRWTPDAVVICLGTNDFAGDIPGRKEWTAGFEAFVARVRSNYPKAMIYCASSPMLWGEKDTTERSYLHDIVNDENKAGDMNVRFLDFKTQQASNGFGADWHPSVKTHEIMADALTIALRQDLHW